MIDISATTVDAIDGLIHVLNRLHIIKATFEWQPIGRRVGDGEYSFNYKIEIRLHPR